MMAWWNMTRPTIFVLTLLATCCDLAMAPAFGQARKSLEPKDGLVCMLVNRNSGRCLSVAFNSVDPGARIVQGPEPAQAGPSEQWKLSAVGEGYHLRNEKSGLLLEIGGKNMNKGVQAVQWHDHKGVNQLWIFEPVNESYILRVQHSQQVLAVGQSKLEEGARVIQWPYMQNLTDQLWQLRGAKDEEATAPDVAEDEHTAPAVGGWMIGAIVCIGSSACLMIASVVAFLLHVRRRQLTANGHKAPEQTPQPLKATCPGCGCKLKLSPEWAGKKVKCSKCGAAVPAPA